MSKIVWTPEEGWTDKGPDVVVKVDDKGRIKAVPTCEECGAAMTEEPTTFGPELVCRQCGHQAWPETT